MKFLRILPETCARTWCLFSSSTRNIAFGNGSITVAMTSMASSFGLPESPFLLSSRCGFAIPLLVACYGRARTRRLQDLTPTSPARPGHFFWPRQDPWAVRGYCDRVLEVRTGAAVRCLGDPLALHPHFRASGV